jgi:hypothetical protein
VRSFSRGAGRPPGVSATFFRQEPLVTASAVALSAGYRRFLQTQRGAVRGTVSGESDVWSTGSRRCADRRIFGCPSRAQAPSSEAQTEQSWLSRSCVSSDQSMLVHTRPWRRGSSGAGYGQLPPTSNGRAANCLLPPGQQVRADQAGAADAARGSCLRRRGQRSPRGSSSRACPRRRSPGPSANMLPKGTRTSALSPRWPPGRRLPCAA